MEKQVIKISVRNLVEFILRSGDIDNRIASQDKDAMQLGAKIHRKIQRQMGASYQAEVTLRRVVEFDKLCIQVEGRADGIIAEDTVYVDEIKGVFTDLERLREPIPVHLAQAKCYACIYAMQQELTVIGVQMTYCNMETEEIKRFRQEYKAEELEAWFQELVLQYEKWGRFQIEWREIRNHSVKQVEFPYAYREGQKNLVTSVYRTILRKKKLFIQAPTGVGKTIATIFPAVKAVGEGLGERIFYLTAKTITRTAASQAFELLKEQDLRYKVITLTAKEKICFCEKADCNPEYCPYAKGHFDRVNDAVYELITSRDDMSRAVLEEQAKKWQVCPFELGLDVSTWMDAIICDYNYVFDPSVHLKRFFGEGIKGENLFLIDEAHNLVERGREMYSASLYKEDVLKIKRQVKLLDVRLARRLEECNKQLLELKRECDGVTVLNSAAHIYLKLLTVMAELERFLEEHKENAVREEVLEFYFEVRTFISVYEKLDENYMIYAELTEDGRFQVRLFCVNPAVNLKEYMEKGNSTIFFSATLLPIHYYKELLSTEKDDYAVYAETAFSEEQRILLQAVDVSTRYTLRGETMYQRYAEYLYRMAKVKKGNYMAFFPSYKFLEQVYDAFSEKIKEEDELRCLVQAPYMSEEAREIFLEGFEESQRGSLMGFCVMGGIFSEGIDLANERLIGAAVVGTGLPQVCRERELLRSYFDGRGLNGFDYAYVYPGMNKVQQSAGRVIRTEKDRGVILLLDERFSEQRYRNTFPREWKGIRLCRIHTVEEQLQEFWDESSSK
ncbi:MAG: ATP-dependent DNA helicase [Eubacteriales bacterium]|nr:ATP-dependent DNA helicase [Eubacteriales bacterium]